MKNRHQIHTNRGWSNHLTWACWHTLDACGGASGLDSWSSGPQTVQWRSGNVLLVARGIARWLDIMLVCNVVNSKQCNVLFFNGTFLPLHFRSVSGMIKLLWVLNVFLGLSFFSVKLSHGHVKQECEKSRGSILTFMHHLDYTCLIHTI